MPGRAQGVLRGIVTFYPGTHEPCRLLLERAGGDRLALRGRLSVFLTHFRSRRERSALSLWVILGISTLYSGVNTVKRLHDLGRPGWHYWLGYIPFYNFYLGIILTFRAGTPGANAYGDNPVTMPLRVTRAGVGLR